MTTKSDLLSQLIRTAESMSPPDRYDKMEFWGRELRRAWSFLMDHEDYYVAHLQKKVPSENIEVAEPSKCPRQDAENQVQELISVGVGYFEYVQSRLDQFRSRWQNSYFLRA